MKKIYINTFIYILLWVQLPIMEGLVDWQYVLVLPVEKRYYITVCLWNVSSDWDPMRTQLFSGSHTAGRWRDALPTARRTLWKRQSILLLMRKAPTKQVLFHDAPADITFICKRVYISSTVCLNVDILSRPSGWWNPLQQNKRDSDVISIM